VLAEIGWISLGLAFALAVYAALTALIGALRHQERFVLSARTAALLTFPLLLIATLALLVALLTQQYQISYVWQVTDPNTPTFYRFTALWGSQRGSLLLWNLTMSGFTAAAVILNWRANHRLMPQYLVYAMATLAFFTGLTFLMENPFMRYWLVPGPVDAAGLPTQRVVETLLIPPDAIAPNPARLAETASGLNPLLRHFGMIIHPPMLYLGFVGFLVPFAFAMAALASGDLSTNWIKAVRKWTLAAWLFLSLGLILGGRWAYDVLGWGGYWGWDPVENAAFIPWLLGTAFLHSVMIQEKRGMLKVWNMFLVLFTFSAVIFGTFATRSGLIDSVHSFAQSEIGGPMFAFWAVTTLISVALLIYRWSRGQLASEHPFGGLISRESLFVLNNVVFVALAAAIFWGSFGAPIISELFLRTDITLGADYFNAVTAPLFLVMYLLMGVAPLTAWGAMTLVRLGRALIVPAGLTLVSLAVLVLTGTTLPGALLGYGLVLFAGWVALYEIARGARARQRTAGESLPLAALRIFTRNRRRYGGFIVHLGITVIGIGVIGSTLFQQDTQRTIARGESIELGGYTLTFDRLDMGQIAEDGRIMDIATLSLYRDGVRLAEIRPRHDYFPQPGGQPAMQMIIAGAHSTLENDFYVLLAGSAPDGSGSSATFRVYINPLVNLIWWGGLILILGTVISVGGAERAPSAARARSVSAGKAAVPA
jgi:cytochrome c-type biogenesis protein CcmF